MLTFITNKVAEPLKHCFSTSKPHFMKFRLNNKCLKLKPVISINSRRWLVIEKALVTGDLHVRCSLAAADACGCNLVLFAIALSEARTQHVAEAMVSECLSIVIRPV